MLFIFISIELKMDISITIEILLFGDKELHYGVLAKKKKRNTGCIAGEQCIC